MAKKRKYNYDDSPGLFDIFEIQDNPDRAQQTPAAPTEPAPAFDPLVVKKQAKTLKFFSFGSGSSGNCAYLGNEKFGILIDAGIDPEGIYRELQRNGIDMSTIGGIILTHDHGDHIRHAYPIVRRNRNLRLYCTPRTINGILRRHNISRRIKDFHQPIFKEYAFHLADFTITPFDVSHDGSDNVGFFIEYEGHKFVVATDMGEITERADFYIRQANHLMIEANYDRSMLINGTYPEYLKARILGPRGHMDNTATAAYLAQIHTPALRNIFLCHLSHDNNTPEIALRDVRKALIAKGLTVGDGSGSIQSRDAAVQLMALPRFEYLGPIILK